VHRSVLRRRYHLLINILLQQPLGSHQIVLIVLLEQGDARRRIDGTEMDRGRINLRSHTGIGVGLAPLDQLQGARFAHQGQILVVDGDCDFGLDRQRDQRHQGHEKNQPERIFH